MASLLLGLLVLVLGFSPATAQVPSLERGPIYIHSDLDFTPENGVTGGTGTSQDPYVIAGWTIHWYWGDPKVPQFPGILSGAAAPVEIRNTTAYFVLRNLQVSDPGPYPIGINLLAANHAKLDNLTISGFQRNLVVQNVVDFEMSNSFIQEATNRAPPFDGLATGILIHDASMVNIHDNTISRNPGRAFFGYRLSNVQFVHNQVEDNVVNAPVIEFRGTSLTISRNNLTRNSGPQGGTMQIEIYESKNVSLTENRVTGNAVQFSSAIDVSRTEGANIAGNTVVKNNVRPDSPLLTLTQSRGIKLDNNILRDGGGDGIFVQGTNNLTTTGNQLANLGKVGIGLQESSNWTSAHDIVVSVGTRGDARSGYGIVLSRTSKVILRTVSIANVTGDGVISANSDIVSTGISISGVGKNGIEINGDFNSLDISDCRISDASEYAIHETAAALPQKTILRIENCEFRDNKLGAVKLENPGAVEMSIDKLQDTSVTGTASGNHTAAGPGLILFFCLACAGAVWRRHSDALR